MALGAAAALVKVAILERAETLEKAAQAPRVVAGAPETTATKGLLAVVGALQAMTTKALEDTTRGPLDLLAMAGALETRAARDLEDLPRGARTMAVTVERVALATARAVDGKLVSRRYLGELEN